MSSQNVQATGRGQSLTSQMWDASLARSGAFIRFFLLTAVVAEVLVFVPNLFLEVEIRKGLYAPVLRTLLAVVRLVPVMRPFLYKLLGLLWQLLPSMDTCMPNFNGSACSGLEPCRGLATALSGWYLISTPMHDAFSPEKGELGSVGDSEEADLETDGSFLLPCAIIMSANVGLFLCDALALTVSPLFRTPESLVMSLPQFPRAQGFVVGEDDAEMGKFDPTCVICIADFEPGEMLSRLPCGHIFHSQCVHHWLTERRHCPLRCSGVVLPPLDFGRLADTPSEHAVTPGREDSDFNTPRGSESSLSVESLSPSLVGRHSLRSSSSERSSVELPHLPSAVT